MVWAVHSPFLLRFQPAIATDGLAETLEKLLAIAVGPKDVLALVTEGESRISEAARPGGTDGRSRVDPNSTKLRVVSTVNGRVIVAALLLASFAASSEFAQPTDAEMSELPRLRSQYLEKYLTLQKTRRYFPRCGTDALLSEFVSAERAKNLGVTGFTVTPEERSVPVLLQDGYPSPLRIESIETRGRGAFSGLLGLLRSVVTRSSEVVAVQFLTLNVTGVTSDEVRFDARVGEACWDEAVEVGHTKTPRGRNSAQTDIAKYTAWLKDVDAAAAAVAHVQEEYQPIRVVSALAAVNHDWTGRGVLLTEADFAFPTLTLHGVARGAAAKSAIDTTLHKARFGLTRIDWSGDGDCAGFIATMQLGALPYERVEIASATIFANRTSDLCGRPPSPSPH
jgi:hypothetical protein